MRHLWTFMYQYFFICEYYNYLWMFWIPVNIFKLVDIKTYYFVYVSNEDVIAIWRSCWGNWSTKVEKVCNFECCSAFKVFYSKTSHVHYKCLDPGRADQNAESARSSQRERRREPYKESQTERAWERARESQRESQREPEGAIESHRNSLFNSL